MTIKQLNDLTQKVNQMFNLGWTQKDVAQAILDRVNGKLSMLAMARCALGGTQESFSFYVNS